jgi:alpha-tubulin suppressor-like RCC1 family protein
LINIKITINIQMLSKVFKRCFSTSGTLLTWGETTYGWGRAVDNKYGVPGPVEGFNNVVQVAAGPTHLTFLTADDAVYSVGYGKDGRLGNGSTSTSESPEKIHISSQDKVIQLACGERHSLALTDKGDVYSWGYAGRPSVLGIELLRVHSPLGRGLTETTSNS